uniref:Uncharacterized protein n=1 Tax=Anopheles farauti TaxID=69004 RepID=A0A182QK06_9DIPT
MDERRLVPSVPYLCAKQNGPSDGKYVAPDTLNRAVDDDEVGCSKFEVDPKKGLAMAQATTKINGPPVEKPPDTAFDYSLEIDQDGHGQYQRGQADRVADEVDQRWQFDFRLEARHRGRLFERWTKSDEQFSNAVIPDHHGGQAKHGNTANVPGGVRGQQETISKKDGQATSCSSSSACCCNRHRSAPLAFIANASKPSTSEGFSVTNPAPSSNERPTLEIRDARPNALPSRWKLISPAESFSMLPVSKEAVVVVVVVVVVVIIIIVIGVVVVVVVVVLPPMVVMVRKELDSMLGKVRETMEGEETELYSNVY